MSFPDTTPSRDAFRVGDRVTARRRPWKVVDVRAFESCSVLTLTGLDRRNRDGVRRLLTPFDDIEALVQPACHRVVKLGKWLRAERTLQLLARPADALSVAARARIDLLPHQLEPALAVVGGLGSRLLLADGVGLGKTVQAALVVAELRARGAADRVLILTPAGLRDQWAEELNGRFDLGASIVDARDARRKSAELPIGVNPWSTIHVAIASIDYVKRPEILPVVQSCQWDIVVIDEAHGVTPQTDRHVAVGQLCARASYVVLLTATPHSGDHAAFQSLCGLGALGAGDKLLVFRRDRAQVRVGPRRKVHQLNIRASSAEGRMHALLAKFTRAVRARRRDELPDVFLALAVLHKRAFSSAYALEQSVRRRLDGLAGAEVQARQLTLPLDEAGETDSSDEAPAWTTSMLDDDETERRLLATLADAAHAAAQAETKLTRLGRLLAILERLHEPAIVFTEYRDTLLHVRRILGRDATVLHGGSSREERRAAVARFRSGRLGLLLATDAAGEGLNLHQASRVVINLELPWNPLRLEQRIGRVDRIGQMRAVHAFHLIGIDTGEARILERLKERIRNARRDIGSADPLTTGNVTEESVSRLVVAGDAGAESAVGQPPPSGDLYVTPQLKDEATREHQRLARVRKLLGGAECNRVTPCDDRAIQPWNETWVAFTSRHNERRGSERSAVAILRASIEDPSGHVVSTHLTAIRVRLSRPVEAESVRRLLAELHQLDISKLDPTWEAWRRGATDLYRRFLATRVRREQAIGQAVAAGGRAALQSGLFDRRAERQRLIVLETTQENSRAASERVAAVTRAGDLDVVASHPVMVLLV